MKYNLFREAQPEPEDDLIAAFDAFGSAEGLECEAESIEDLDYLGGWNATVRNEAGDEITIHSTITV